MKARGWKILPFACALLLGTAGAEAATFTVNTTNDTSDADVGDGICADLNGKCSLRAAIMQANFTNAIGPSNSIIVPAGIYKLTRPGNDDNAIIGDLDITATMSIQGAGSGLTIVDGNGAVTGDRVFQILPSAPNTSLGGMTIRNGIRTGTFDEGGGLYWQGGGGPLHLRDLIVESNSSYDAGGLSFRYSSSAFNEVVDLDHVIVRDNVATAAAGGLGVALQDYATFKMRNCQVYGNTAYEGGGLYFQNTTTFGFISVLIDSTEIYSNTASLSGGIENHNGTNTPIILQNCHLYKNIADFYGGAIGNYGTLIVSASTIDSNVAGMRGGGIYNYGSDGTVMMTNSTISGNMVTNGSGGGIYNGASLSNVGGSLNLLNCTIASNSAANGFGGGISNQNGTVTIKGSIIAGNIAQSAASGPDFAGPMTAPNFDLFGSSSGFSYPGLAQFSQFNVNPRLGPLQDNGGPTPTHALLPGSPAIDVGRSIGLVTDQRGAPRPIDDPASPNGAPSDLGDLGAFEVGRPPQLAIQKSGNAAVVSWPYYYGGFSVQSVTNLGSTNAWTTVAGTPVVSGDQYVFTNSPITGKKFYRLKGN